MRFVMLANQRDTSLIARLRAELESAHARLGKMDRELGITRARVIEVERCAEELRNEYNELRNRFVGVADALPETEDAELRGAVWWMAAFRASQQLRIEAVIRLTQCQTWLKEQGAESARLQAELTASREEIGQLERRIAEAEHDLDEERAHHG